MPGANNSVMVVSLDLNGSREIMISCEELDHRVINNF